MKFWDTLVQIFRTPDLRAKVLLTVALLLLFRVISHIPVPNVDPSQLSDFFSGNQFFGLMDMFSGGSLSRFSIAAMGVNPYINASIIMNLLTIIVPKLEELSKDGERGRQQINQYTRYLTVPLAAIQGYGLVMLFGSSEVNILPQLSLIATLQIVLTLTAGTILLMWIGEIITRSGIGNGISLIIFAGIVGELPSMIQGLQLRADSGEFESILLFLGVTLLSVVMVVFINEGHRKIPVTYAKRIRGGQTTGGGSTHIPLKVNTAGVIPIIFAISIMSFPTLIANFFTTSDSDSIRNAAQWVIQFFTPQSFAYYSIYFLLVIGFTYFYTLVTFNPQDVADNLKKQGGFIPGIRPGEGTVDYLSKILNRITLVGALFLGAIAVIPFIVESATNISAIIGGTSLLIIVSVILETMRQIRSQLVMRDYEEYLGGKS